MCLWKLWKPAFVPTIKCQQSTLQFGPPVEEELWKTTCKHSAIHFDLSMARKAWHFFAANRFKSCQVMCGQRSLESEVQSWMVKHGLVLDSPYFIQEYCNIRTW